MVVLFLPLLVPRTLSAACGVDPPLTAEGFIWPASGPVSTSWTLDCRTDRGHRGIDIAVSAGDVIKASASGVVVFAGYTPAEGGGMTISIEHPGGIRTTYLHLAQANVSRGEAVEQGQELGSSDGSPLHFGMKMNAPREIYFNPVTYLTSPDFPAAPPAPSVETGAGAETGAPYPIMPTSETLPAQSSAGAAAVLPEGVYAGSTAVAADNISESRQGEVTASSTIAVTGRDGISTSGVQAFSSDHASGTHLDSLENLSPEIIKAATIESVSSGILTPFSAGAISTLKQSGERARPERQLPVIAGVHSPVRNLLLAALLFMVTAGCGRLGNMPSPKHMNSARNATCQAGS